MIKRTLLPLLILILTLSACQDATPAEIPVEVVPESSIPSTALISEVMAGITGNNNYEFIELYNPGDTTFSLQDFSLWYRLPTSEEDLLLYQWASVAGIPSHGHYLLVREDQDVGIMPNAIFTQALNTGGGGLLLRDSLGETADSLGWGNAPELFTEGEPAAILENGMSLERYPGRDDGNHQDTGNNAADFQLSDSPGPQNSGSDPVPYFEQLLVLKLDVPETVEPGSDFEYLMTITNEGDQTLDEIVAVLFLDPDLVIRSLPESMEAHEEIVLWTIDQLNPGDNQTEALPLTAPWAYLDYRVDVFFAQVGDSELAYFAPPSITRSAGGTIPIGTARGLIGSELTIEGIATMYTGGYYAGSGNNKFYLEDETGGIQVQVFDGEGTVNVPIGAHVRVKGTVGIYRDSIQINPIAVPEDVEILSPPGDYEIPLSQTSIRQATFDLESLPGRLIQVEGNITRVEEFTYSYEIDLVDEGGNLIRCYVDKQTEMSVEKIKAGFNYAATGILDLRDGDVLLYPRIQSDLREVLPPALKLTLEAPNTTLLRETFTVTLTATNYSPTTTQDLIITATLPASGTTLGAVSDGGALSGRELTWEVAELAGDGTEMSVSFDLSAFDASDQFSISSSMSSSTEEVEILTAEPWTIFIGTSLPIWAIQGTGNGSPYVLDEARTAGVITGIFPSLEGFFIQSAESDNNPSTSEGLFIWTSNLPIKVVQGDAVEIYGLIREIGQQTQIEILSSEDIQVTQQGIVLPEPIQLEPPQGNLESEQYYESLEGMLVEVASDAIAISPTSRYGEYVVVLEEHNIDRIWQGEAAGYMIMVDDGTSDVHNDSSSLEYIVAAGDRISGLEGPLAFTYGRYKIEPLVPPVVTADWVTPEPLPSLDTDQFSIMTWNVENLFDIVVPHPTDPPLPRRSEYELALTKVANTILAAGTPTIIGFHEVDNVGILEDLAEHELLFEHGYIPILLEGTDSRGIDVGYLVRGDQAEILDVQQHPAPEGTTSRHPLLIQVEVETSEGTITLFLINNHFTSMSGGELATEPRRSAQAAWNVSVMETVLMTDPDAHVVVLGDLNSYFDAKPIDILRDADLRHVFEALDPDERYTYIFQGASQALDHILVSAGLWEVLEDVYIYHANAEFPPADPDDPSPLHKSDHDPVIAVFTINS